MRGDSRLGSVLDAQGRGQGESGVVLLPRSAAAQTYPADQVQAGQRLFAAQCGFCHGRDAMGGETGPDLARSAFVRDDVTGDRMRAVLRDGRVDKGMPAFRLTDADVTAIVAFIRDQKTKGRFARRAPAVDPEDLQTGNSERGRQYFNGAGRCATCHSPTGDLAGVATRLQGLELLQRMLYPAPSRVAQGHASQRDVPSGETVSGQLVHRDEFTIALTDSSDRYRSWRTADVTIRRQQSTRRPCRAAW